MEKMGRKYEINKKKGSRWDIMYFLRQSESLDLAVVEDRHSTCNKLEVKAKKGSV